MAGLKEPSMSLASLESGESMTAIYALLNVSIFDPRASVHSEVCIFHIQK